jgi:UPF0755 protein
MKKNIKIIIILILISIPIFVYYRRENNKPTPQPLSVREEVNVTIIPGWNLKQIAENWKAKGFIKNEKELYDRVGMPAFNYKAVSQKAPTLNFSNSLGKESYPLLSTRPKVVSYEGYFFPDTYRVYKDAKLEDVLNKVFTNLEKKITDEMRTEMNKQGKNLFQVLTMASIVEREANNATDMRLVADIFWRRHAKNWALQSCASVNYVTGKNVPYISLDDQKIDSPYNTYKYPGLPLGPVGNPGITAIKATLYPKTNSHWYFMTGKDGKMYYATTLDQHNSNVYNYLR